MIDQKHFNEDIKKLLKLVDTKFGIQADDLSYAMRKIGRRLPHSVHRHAAKLAEVQRQLAHPKIALQIDEKPLVKPYAAVLSALESYDPVDRRKGAILSTLGAIVFNLIVVFVIFVAVLKWRGFV